MNCWLTEVMATMPINNVAKASITTSSRSAFFQSLRKRTQPRADRKAPKKRTSSQSEWRMPAATWSGSMKSAFSALAYIHTRPAAHGEEDDQGNPYRYGSRYHEQRGVVNLVAAHQSRRGRGRSGWRSGRGRCGGSRGRRQRGRRGSGGGEGLDRDVEDV